MVHGKSLTYLEADAEAHIPEHVPAHVEDSITWSKLKRHLFNSRTQGSKRMASAWQTARLISLKPYKLAGQAALTLSMLQIPQKA